MGSRKRFETTDKSHIWEHKKVKKKGGGHLFKDNYASIHSHL